MVAMQRHAALISVSASLPAISQVGSPVRARSQHRRWTIPPSSAARAVSR